MKKELQAFPLDIHTEGKNCRYLHTEEMGNIAGRREGKNEHVLTDELPFCLDTVSPRTTLLNTHHSDNPCSACYQKNPTPPLFCPAESPRFDLLWDQMNLFSLAWGVKDYGTFLKVDKFRLASNS